MAERIQFTKAVNRILVPCLLELGFGVKGDTDPRVWKEGCYFTRVQNGRQQWILFGRVVSGHQLGWNIGREREAGGSEYMEYTNYGLASSDLVYQTQAELDQLLHRLARFAREEMSAWYGAKEPTRAGVEGSSGRPTSG